jgi:hypothetical protein
MHKGKALSISLPPKSPEELASRLGVSKSRTARISEIVSKDQRTGRFLEKKRRAGHAIPKSAGRNSRTGQRRNAIARKQTKTTR